MSHNDKNTSLFSLPLFAAYLHLSPEHFCSLKDQNTQMTSFDVISTRLNGTDIENLH